MEMLALIFFKSSTKSYSKSGDYVDIVFEGWFFVLIVELSSVGVVEDSPREWFFLLLVLY